MKKILLVDQDDLFTNTLFFLLEQDHFGVTIAKDGKQAAEALATMHFDLVITDLFMPYSNGFELINSIHQDKTTEPVPVIVISDVTNLQSIANCYRLGAEAYFQKPLNVLLLLSEIKRLMQNQNNVAA